MIQFNNTVRSLFPTLEPVTTASIRKAVRYTEQMSADGGTEILPALRQALKHPQDTSRIQQIVLLTDGQVGDEEELFEMLHYKLGTRRLFTIGIGSTPNSYLMRKTAEFGRGTFTYIGNIEEVKDRLDRLFKKLERPVLNDIAFDPTGWSGTEQYPSQIADLYEGEPVMLAIKTQSLPPQTMLKGLAGHHPWTLPVSFKQASSQGGLSIFWARQKISALMDETYKGGVEEAIKKAVIDVAVTHHLVSKYTSLVAVDVTPARPTDHESTDHAPAAIQDQASVAALPKTSTIGQLQILVGVILLTMAGLVWHYRKRMA